MKRRKTIPAPSIRTSVYLSPETAVLIKMLAKAEQRTQSAILTRALHHYAGAITKEVHPEQQ